MGCEAHPDTADRTFKCYGDLREVFDPYFVNTEGVEFPHWNGAEAFTATPTSALKTDEAVLTDIPGRFQLAEVAGMAAVRSET